MHVMGSGMWAREVSNKVACAKRSFVTPFPLTTLSPLVPAKPVPCYEYYNIQQTLYQGFQQF